MVEIEVIQTILILLVGFGAGFVQRVSGFGLGIFAMMFMPYFMSTHTAAATISCIFSCGTSTYNAVKYKRHIPFKIIIPLICISLVTIPVSVYFSVMVSANIFKIILGVFLILLSIYFFAFDNRIKLKANLKNSLISGGLGGVLNGLFSTGGPPVVIYLSCVVDDKMMYFSGLQFYFAVINVYTLLFRIFNGVVTLDILLYAMIGFSGCMFGDMIGRRVFDKLDGKGLKKVIYAGMIISGVIMCF